MCSFLLVGVPKGATVELTNRVEGRALSILAIEPSRLPPSFPVDMRALFLTSGGCSCDLYVRRRQDHEDERAAAYRKKGWSDTKVRRALSQHRAARAGDDEPGFRSDVRALLMSWFDMFGSIAIAYFVTGGDPIDDIPAPVTRASLAEIVSSRFEPDERSVMLISS